MKIANVSGRAALVLGDEIADIATVSGGRFGPEPMGIYEDWMTFSEFAATVTTTTGVECVTPCELKLKRKDGFTATFTLPGYETQTAEVDSVFTGGAALAGNAIFGGLIGAGVDASNGSLNGLSPNPLNVDLVPVGTAAAAAPMASTEAAPAAEPAVETVPEATTPPTGE